MWFDPDRQEQRGARIIGELNAEAFLDRHAQASQSANEILNEQHSYFLFSFYRRKSVSFYARKALIKSE